MRSRSLLFASLMFGLGATAHAQPDVRDHRPPPPHERGERDHRGAPAAGPIEAPPSPREEKVAARAGFVWIPGRWDWHDRWDWVAGHWERERAGKQWHAGHWDRNGTAWTFTEGQWVDVGATPPATTPPPATPPGPPPPPAAPPPTTTEPAPPPGDMPPVRDHRHEWKLDRPVVSSYWPTKGKAGARVRIHGRNFPADAMVVFADQPVKGAKVTADEIVFEIPATATTGTIAVRRDRGRDLIVGPFEVAAAYDADAEAKRVEDERRKAAEAAWATRAKELAKDRAQREAAWRDRDRDRDANREQRRADRVAQIRAKWDAAFLSDPDTQAELTLHAQRLAQLARARDVAEVNANGKLVVRIDVATTKENDRHDQRMQALQQQFKTKGGTP